jgi:hypothetical protein
MENVKIGIWLMKNQSISIDRALSVVFGIDFWANPRRNYSNPLITSHRKMPVIWDFSDHNLDYEKSELIIG